MKDRLTKYFIETDMDEIQELVLKEKQENVKKKRIHFSLGSKEFSNYLVASGVKLSATEFISAWALSTFIPLLLAYFISGATVSIAAAGIIGFAIPPVLVQHTRKKQQEEFNKQLAESLTIMENSIKAGFTFQQAMESIAAEMQPPIATEFARSLREMRYGVSMEDALRHMVDRVKNKDLDLLVCAFLTSAQVGGNLSEILSVIADTVKDRIKIKADVRVLTAQGRMSGLIIGLLPVVLILVLMLVNPEYFGTFFESQIGKIMMMVAVGMETAGFLVIRKLVDIQY
jgi:tight adherence protein B